MFVVQDLKSKLFFKRGNYRSRWDAKLVKRQEATVFRSQAGIKNCLGKSIKFVPPKILKSGRRVFRRRELDTKEWKIIEIKI